MQRASRSFRRGWTVVPLPSKNPQARVSSTFRQHPPKRTMTQEMGCAQCHRTPAARHRNADFGMLFALLDICRRLYFIRHRASQKRKVEVLFSPFASLARLRFGPSGDNSTHPTRTSSRWTGDRLLLPDRSGFLGCMVARSVQRADVAQDSWYQRRQWLHCEPASCPRFH